MNADLVQGPHRDSPLNKKGFLGLRGFTLLIVILHRDLVEISLESIWRYNEFWFMEFLWE